MGVSSAHFYDICVFIEVSHKIMSFSRGNKTPRFVKSHYATQQTRVKQGIKYFFGSFISTFLWYLCIYRSESKNQNENFKYHIYCIHVLNGFVKMNCMLPLKALKYTLLVCNKIKVKNFLMFCYFLSTLYSKYDCG